MTYIEPRVKTTRGSKKGSTVLEIDIINVNKYESGWNPDILFEGFNVRVLLKQRDEILMQIEEVGELQKKLKRNIGKEGKEWVILRSHLNRESELYLKDTSRLVMWKLKNQEEFFEFFDKVEEHA